MRRVPVLVLVTLAFVIGLGVVSPSFAQIDNGDHREVVFFTGAPTAITSIDLTGFPIFSISADATTTEGSVTFTDTVDFFTGILSGTNNSGVEGELIVADGAWDFGGGNTLTANHRIYISPVLETATCSEFVGQDYQVIITGGTGRFVNARGNIQVRLDPSCFDDLFSGPVPVSGSIEGMIVLADGAELVGEIIDQVEELGLPTGLTNGLSQKLEAAANSIEAGNQQAAIGELGAFISQVTAQAGNQIPQADAEELIADAQQVIELLTS